MRRQKSDMEKLLRIKERKEEIMYKKFKRLLGLLMVFAMLVGLVPLNGMTQVNAANDSAANMTVYLQVTDNWKQENAAFGAYLWETGHDSKDADGTYYKDFTPVWRK